MARVGEIASRPIFRGPNRSGLEVALMMTVTMMMVTAAKAMAMRFFRAGGRGHGEARRGSIRGRERNDDG